VKSTDDEGKVRYIEVKARAQEGEIVLTQNEWFKAKRFADDYYIYVVMSASSKPQLYTLRNPVDLLTGDEIIEFVRYKVPVDVILAKGDAAAEK
jgi:hypothetical protein